MAHFGSGTLAQFAPENAVRLHKQYIGMLKQPVLSHNIDQPIISRIEKGDRIVADYEIKAIAKALKVTVEWLLKEK